MHQRIERILTKAAKTNGWVPRGVLENWNHHYPAFLRDGKRKPPDLYTFWYHLEDNENLIIGFDWNRKKPNTVRTINGSLPATTPINFSYVSSHKKLVSFFADTKEQFNDFEKKPKTFLGKIKNWVAS